MRRRGTVSAAAIRALEMHDAGASVEAICAALRCDRRRLARTLYRYGRRLGRGAVVPLTDEQARTVAENLGLVHAVVGRRYRRAPLERGDLMQAGALGLIEAVKKHRAGPGAFSSLAVIYIAGAINAALRAETPRGFRKARVGAPGLVSLETGGDDGEPVDAEDDSPTPEECILASERDAQVREALETLPRRAREVAYRRVAEGCDVPSLARRLRVSERQITRIERSLGPRLRDALAPIRDAA